MTNKLLGGGGSVHDSDLQPPRSKSWFSKVFATLLTAMLSSAALLLATPAAYADHPGFNATVLHNGSALADDAVVAPGDTFTFNTQYTPEVGDGAEVVLGVPEGVSVPEGALVVPDGNTAIESIARNDAGDIVITFADPFPVDVQEGVHAIDLVFDEVEYTESRTIEWTVAGTPYTRDIVVQHPDEHSVSNWTNKERGGGNLYAQYVSVDDEGNVELSDDLVDYQIPYTLTIRTDGETDRSEFSIEDSFDNEYLAYNDDFSATITQWDENGLNPEDSSFDDFAFTVEGNSFSGTANIPSPSELTISYSASVSADQVQTLRDDLQAQYDAVDGPYGSFVLELGNTAVMGGAEETAQINIGTTVDVPSGPSVGEAFGKNADWWRQLVEPAEDGTLEPPLDVTYTFDADLSAWDGREDVPNPQDFVLDRNVVISDNLPTQAEWNITDDAFITAEGIDLTQAADFDGDAAAFADDEYEGRYAVVGQDLYINIGQNSDTNVTVSANALINTIDGLNSGSEDSTGFTEYYLDNEALFTFSDEEEPHEDTAWLNLIDRGDTTGGVNVPNRFSKTADGDDTEYVAPGETATIDYSFVVNGDDSQADAVDVTNSYIVDERDPNVFDLSDLEEIRSGITGQYSSRIDLGPEHFDVSTNDEGNLVIALSDAGLDAISDEANDTNLQVNVPLTTYPLAGKQTITVENSATLYGSDDEALYWSETSSEASSFGSESEVRKTIRDTPNNEWTQNLRVEVGEDGELIQDEYVYNLAYIAHGSFTNLPSIDAVHDELPDNLEFVGFVTDDNVDTGEGATDGPVDIGGNLEAFYDEDSHTVTVHLPENETLVSEDGMIANVLVRVTDFTADVPVANMFGSSTAIFTPSDGYPLSIAKVDSEDQEVIINDPDSRFQILDAEENVVIEDAFVEDGQLRVLDDEGDVSGLVVREPGTYYVEETVAPEGYELSDQRIQVTVDEDGSSQQVTFPNVPADEPDPAVEIIKGDGDADAGTIANDANTEDDAVAYEDGETRDIVFTVENTGTEDLIDVVLTDETTSGADIQELVWTLPNGETVEAEEVDGVLTATWDGPWAVGYQITGVASLTIAAGDELHTNLASVDAVGAGSGTPVEDDDPYNAQPADPTYAIGDYVWIDADRDGIQGEPEDGEHPLNGVTVVLYDGDGEERDRTTTGADGRYIFDNLPAGEYQVGFELTEDQADRYEFTDYTQGDDVAEDSDAGENNRSAVFTLGDDSPLVDDDNYEYNTVEASEGIDPTWDAGVIRPAVTVGDYVWLDENRDGLQDDEEDGIEGVVLNIVGPDGEPVADVWGNPVGPQTTDENGRYLFEELPVLEDDQSYTVTIDREASEEALAPYVPTVENQGDERANDSSTWEASTQGLTENGDEDLTLDFGFVEKTYAIGDYVWIDSNDNGLQGGNEDPLEGVTVHLYTVDEEGDRSDEPVATTETDANGRYLFDDLPAGQYQVQFVLTDEQADIYDFTSYTEGQDVGVDSNAGENGFSAVITLDAENTSLTTEYDAQEFNASEGVDPTWDAGVVLKPEEDPTDPSDPTGPSSPEPTDPSDLSAPTDPSDPTEGPGAGDEEDPNGDDSGLASTGAAGILLLVALGVALLAAGGTLFARKVRA